MSTVAKVVLLRQSEPEIQDLAGQLSGFWAADQWDMAQCPLLPAGTSIGHIYVKFDCPSASLNTELKYACWRKLEERNWSLRRGAKSAMCRVRVIIRFLKEVAPTTQSLLEKEIDEWLSLLQAYLQAQGRLETSTVAYLDKTHHIRHYQSQDTRLMTLRGLYKLIQEARDNRPEYEKDIWDVRQMGASLSPADISYRLNFTKLAQSWLRQVAKRYIRHQLAFYSVAHCRWSLHALNNFSAFLSQLKRPVQPVDINRSLIVEYLAYLAETQPGPKTRQNNLVYLRDFLEACSREGWADFPKQRLILAEDIPRPPRPLPRPIPEEILQQLNQHLDRLAEPYRQMAIILQECGMRISELCTLALDCLSQDQEGDWFLHYYQSKMKKDHPIPITETVAAVIQAQQQAVREKWGNDCAVLFPNRNGKPIHKINLAQALNQLAYEQGIRDTTGRLFHFRAHDFRHTVATRMLRNGVRQHHVQRYLGHESPEMTMIYAQITDQDLKKAFVEYQQLSVDVTGKVLAEEWTVASTDLQWFKKNILAQALPHGYCALPVLAEPCPFPNACFTCANFRTNIKFLGVLKAELAETERLLNLAQANNWIRQIEINEQVKSNLQKIITALEGGYHDAPKKC